MYKIGDFSNISKTPIKTLRYYEKEGLLVPAYVNQDSGYRYYETKQLLDLAKIISYRQIGMSIQDIKEMLKQTNAQQVLRKRKKEIEDHLILYSTYLSKINYLLEEDHMDHKIILKDIKEVIVFYKEGVLKQYGDMASFVVEAGEECAQLNPTIKCSTPDYCYVSYLDGEYKQENIRVRYSQAMEEMGVGNENIKFEKVDAIKAVCIYHTGSYDYLRDSYAVLSQYIEKNGYEMNGFARECYIDGCWNKDDEREYLTEIQIPIK